MQSSSSSLIAYCMFDCTAASNAEKSDESLSSSLVTVARLYTYKQGGEQREHGGVRLCVHSSAFVYVLIIKVGCKPQKEREGGEKGALGTGI